MKGYKKPVEIPDMTPIKEQMLVGCRRCWGVWREEHTTYKGMVRINGPSYMYDYCDNCITEDERGQLSSDQTT